MSGNVEESLVKKIDALPERLRAEVEVYVNRLHQRARASESEEQSPRTLGLEWRGALKHLRGQYTSDQLQT